jgi:hypothetical protein
MKKTSAVLAGDDETNSDPKYKMFSVKANPPATHAE